MRGEARRRGPTSHCLLFLGLSVLSAGGDRPPELQAAIGLFQQGKNTEAKMAFEHLAAAYPDDFEARQYLGRLALRADDPKEAAQHLERAVALSPRGSEVHKDLGDAYGRLAQKANVFTRMGWASKCRSAYERAVALDPRNVDARLSLLTFYQQAPGLAGGGMDKAYAQAAEIGKLDARRGREARAGLLAADKRFSEAFTLLEQSVTESPEDYTALYAIGRLAATTGENLDRGLETLRKCLTLSPPEGAPGRTAAYWRIGNILQKKGDRAAARLSYETALKLDPNFAAAQKSLADLR
jgi:tetratricopeptide (TPR) repeat protein